MHMTVKAEYVQRVFTFLFNIFIGMGLDYIIFLNQTGLLSDIAYSINFICGRSTF
jgi:hypothetical protein